MWSHWHAVRSAVLYSEVWVRQTAFGCGPFTAEYAKESGDSALLRPEGRMGVLMWERDSEGQTKALCIKKHQMLVTLQVKQWTPAVALARLTRAQPPASG